MPHVGTGVQLSDPFSIPDPGYKQGAESEVKQVGHKAEHLRDAVASGGGRLILKSLILGLCVTDSPLPATAFM